MPEWRNLPTELKVRVVMLLERSDWEALSRVDRMTRGVLKDCPALPWMQGDLLEAIEGKRSSALTDALEKHQAALRARDNPIQLPQYSSQGVLDCVAGLVRGSGQRPRLRYTKRDATYDVQRVPPEIDATLEIHNERWLPAQALRLPLGLGEANLAFNAFSSTITHLELPADLARVVLHGVGVGERAGGLRLNSGARFVGLDFNRLGIHVGLLNLNDGVEEVCLAHNNLGVYAALVRFPPSVRRADMHDNHIDEATAATLRENYPDVQFEF
jgi:hypothetical protein